MDRKYSIGTACLAGTTILLFRLIKKSKRIIQSKIRLWKNIRNFDLCKESEDTIIEKIGFETGQFVLFKSDTPLGIDAGYILQYDEADNVFHLCNEDGDYFVVRARNIYKSIEDAFPELSDGSYV